MNESKCTSCGAELSAGMNFCRQCGASVVVSPDASEQPTAMLNQSTASPTTQRLDPRPTGTGYQGAVPPMTPMAAPTGTPVATSRGGSARWLIVVGIVIALLIGISSVVGVMKSVLRSRAQRQNQSRTNTVVRKPLVYPGAKTVLDVTSQDGTGVLQLQSADPIDKVADWYEAHLKPTKTVRVGPTVIMKNDNVSATIVSDGSNTNILIKQMP